MTTDLPTLYGKYVSYVRRLQEDFALNVGPDVAPAYRPQLLSFEEFERVWRAWGDSAREIWRQRFEAGYDVVSEALSACLRAALCRRDVPRAAHGTKGKAA